MRNITFLNTSQLMKKWEKALIFFPLQFFQHLKIISEFYLGLYNTVCTRDSLERLRVDKK